MSCIHVGGHGVDVGAFDFGFKVVLETFIVVCSHLEGFKITIFGWHSIVVGYKYA